MQDYWTNFWSLFLEAAPYLVVGFVVAGLLHQFLPKNLVARFLGGSSGKSIFKASLIGTPVPLCSCGVVPVALGLHKDGASKPAVISFLISTPENGVESISLTYSFFGLPFTVARVVFAIIVANLTALAVSVFDRDSPRPTTPTETQDSCCTDKPSCCSSVTPAKETKRDGLRFVLNEFVPAIANWVILGFLLSAAIATFLPKDLLSQLDPQWAVPLAGLVGIPMYVCASASTPIAFSLFMNGLSPGACLVFLLTGPATNSANLPLYLKSFGSKTTTIYYTGIYAVSVALGLILDLFMDPKWLLQLPQHGHLHNEPSLISYAGAVCLTSLLLHGVWQKFANKSGGDCCG